MKRVRSSFYCSCNIFKSLKLFENKDFWKMCPPGTKLQRTSNAISEILKALGATEGFVQGSAVVSFGI